MSLSTYDVIRNSYAPQAVQARAFTDMGFQYQPKYSNGNQQAYWSPSQKKLLFSVAGTHNASDVSTDVLLGVGVGFKESRRYQEAKNALASATRELAPTSRMVVGSSLGGTIARGISSQGDELVTYNAGETLGSTRRPFEQTLRTEGDLVSLAGAWRKGVQTLPDRNRQSALGFVGNSLQAHSSQNLKGSNFFL